MRHKTLRKAAPPTGRLTVQLVLLLPLITTLVFVPAARADPIIPPVWDIVADDFESGSLAAWSKGGTQSASLLSGGGRGGSTGLSIL